MLNIDVYEKKVCIGKHFFIYIYLKYYLFKFLDIQMKNGILMKKYNSYDCSTIYKLPNNKKKIVEMTFNKGNSGLCHFSLIDI